MLDRQERIFTKNVKDGAPAFSKRSKASLPSIISGLVRGALITIYDTLFK